jgi:drug/metabolite transporter (DMT)-like permease
MANIDKLNKQIDRLEGKIRFFRNALLAIISGLVWSIYAILEKKVGSEILVLSIVGTLVLIFIFIRVKSLEIKQDNLIDELEKE